MIRCHWPQSRLRRGLAAALLLTLTLLPLSARTAVDPEDVEDGNCNTVREELNGTVSQHKKYDPPYETRCGRYLSKIVIWEPGEDLPYRGYVLPDTECYLDFQPLPCEQVRKNDRVRAVFDRKVNSVTRGLLRRVDVMTQ